MARPFLCTFPTIIVNFQVNPPKTVVGGGAPRSGARDEGRPLEVGLQEQASNHLKLLWLRARELLSNVVFGIRRRSVVQQSHQQILLH